MPVFEEDQYPKAFYALNAVEIARLRKKVSIDPSRLDVRIATVLELIESPQIRRIDLESVAALLQLSSSRLRHLFKEQVGIPFHRYVILVQLEKVRQTLQTTSYPVVNVARMFDFHDISHFSYIFKRTYGVTPGSIRTAKRVSSDKLD
jgi:AraC-like DNA-binding protein